MIDHDAVVCMQVLFTSSSLEDKEIKGNILTTFLLVLFTSSYGAFSVAQGASFQNFDYRRVLKYLEWIL